MSRFGYHSWKRHGISIHPQRDIELAKGIEKIFGDFDGIYGSPKIHQMLLREGVSVGKNRVARLMQENSLKARSARLYRSRAAMDWFYASINNQIKEVEATRPNQIWVG